MTFESSFVTFEIVMAGVLVFLALAQFIVAIRGLRTGRWQGLPFSDLVYERASDPRAYWREALLTLFTFLLIVVGLLIMPPRVEGSFRDPPYGALIFVVFVAPALIRALWAGEIVFGNNRWSRRETPYWVMTFIGLLMVATFVFSFAREIGR